MKRIIPVLMTVALLTLSMVLASCNLFPVEEPEPEHVHSFVDTVVDPTCKAEGYTLHTCSECGYVMMNQFEPVNAKAHLYEIVETVDATCTEKGYVREQCKYCKVEKVTELEPAHDFGEWITVREMDCDVDGENHRYCKNCAEFEVEIIPAEHRAENEVATEVEGTCKTPGYTKVTCTKCDFEEIRDYVEYDHSFGDWVAVTSTCTSEGISRRTCSECGCIEEAIRVSDHVYSIVTVVEPTDTAMGYTEHACVCGDSYRDTYVSTKGTEGLVYETVGEGEDAYKILAGVAEGFEGDTIVIPSENGGVKVTVVGVQALYNLKGVTKVYLTNTVTKFDIAAFWHSGVTEFNFEGTVEEWNAIDKGDSWNNAMQSFVVNCTDGTVE